MNADRIILQAKEVLRTEADGLLSLVERIGPAFAAAVETIYQARGRVVVAGLGKSGLVGRKIAATLNSTGTPAFFLHPVEALHGDLGMVQPDDVVLAMSNSGETLEVISMLDSIKAIGAKVIALTGNPESTLAREADLALDAGVPKEACPLGLAPTTSTTAALALGDALAVALISVREFKQSDFQRLHPGGTLGERLSVQVRQVMLTIDQSPTVAPDVDLPRAMNIMDELNLGVLIVIDHDLTLKGIFTDGDLRRAVVAGRNLAGSAIRDLMTPSPIAIRPRQLAVEALEIMQTHEITVLPIVDDDQRLLGVINLHHLLGKGKFHFNHNGRRSGV